jgi:phosphoribosylaminoimidazole-succinocarboxamide synthase
MESQLNLPGSRKTKGKIREMYHLGDGRVVMVTTDRISAFDKVLKRGIPNKGAVLNRLSCFMFAATRDIVPNWVVNMADPQAMIGIECEPLKVEMVVRGYLTGSLYRDVYSKGEREVCGLTLPARMREFEQFAKGPIITPTTKGENGEHDRNLTPEEILDLRLCTSQEWEMLKRYSMSLFQRGVELTKKQGLILVDTKYEFGRDGDMIRLIDEVHTPDSSRYWYQDGYELAFEQGRRPNELSKEFVRQWLIDQGFQGRDGDVEPGMDDDFVQSIGQRYVKLYEKVTGERFASIPQGVEPNQRIQNAVDQVLYDDHA